MGLLQQRLRPLSAVNGVSANGGRLHATGSQKIEVASTTLIGFKSIASINDPSKVIWSFPANAFNDDSVYTTSVLTVGAESEIIDFSNLRNSVPKDATIVGIEVVPHWYASAATSARTKRIQLTGYSGEPIGTPKSGNILPNIATYDFIGAPTDMWGASITPQMINGYGFGVEIELEQYGAGIVVCFIDWVGIAIYYT